MASVAGWKPQLLSVVTVATAGTRVQFNASGPFACAVLIQADKNNTGNVYIGDVGVGAANGIALAPNQSMSFDTMLVRGCMEDFDLSDWYADADTNGNKVRVMYMRRK